MKLKNFLRGVTFEVLESKAQKYSQGKSEGQNVAYLSFGDDMTIGDTTQDYACLSSQAAAGFRAAEDKAAFLSTLHIEEVETENGSTLSVQMPPQVKSLGSFTF